MKMRVLAAVAVAIPLAFGTSRLLAQGNSDVQVPDSSIEKPGERGVKAHTNHVISLRGANPDGRPSSPSGKTPQQIRTAYGLPSTGGSGVIAIVDAFDYPTALADFNKFSHDYGLPQETGNGSVFEVVYAGGSQPTLDCGWAQEAALDIEWAHAMAPNAKIILVEAATNSLADLFAAVDVAAAHGASQVSMSWGSGEFAGETSFDSYFDNANIAYFAASGDTGGKTIYPGVSQYVLAAGGTSLTLNADNTIKSETGWSGSGGGRSAYVQTPPYQSAIANTVNLGGKRGVPDFSFDADPNTGVLVYDSTSCGGLVGWLIFGGTSVSSPSLAGIANLAGGNHGSNPSDSNSELSTIYSGLGGSNFNDILSGRAGSFRAGTGWDFVTGVGSNHGTDGK
jgi:subtilase family serine protease